MRTRELGAAAYTVGDDIFFRTGQYRPDSPMGALLIAHEVAHSIQQARGGRPPEMRSDAPHEMDATQAAHAAISGRGRTAVRDATAPGVARQDQTAAHAGGALGELDLGFALGQRGFTFFIGPGGPGGHPLTGHGFDAVAYNPSSGELWLVDNKATGGIRNVGSASAVTTNLESSLTAAIQEVSQLQNVPNQPLVLQKLNNALNAVRSGSPLPSDVKLKVSNAGGYAKGLGPKLTGKVDFEDVTGPQVRAARASDIAKAEKAGVKTGRPSSQAGTDAMRQKVAAADAQAVVAMRAQTGRVSPGALATPAADEGAVAAAKFRAQSAASAAADELKILRVTRAITVGLAVLQFISDLQMIADFTAMAESGMAGKGFILTRELAQARELAQKAADWRTSYVEFSARLSANQFKFWAASSDPASAGRVSTNLGTLRLQLQDIQRDLADQIQRVRLALREANAKEKAADAILSDPKASGVIAAVTFGDVELARIFAAYEDWIQISGALNTAVGAFDAIAGMVSADVLFLSAWEDALFAACLKGGACYEKQFQIPFLGTSTVHVLPGE
jgi:hypothetical protein